ncbi:MAG TPA: amino acid adenylation domain-containing protein [Actinoplanes sp.]
MGTTTDLTTPASYSQEGLWLLEQLAADPAVNNLPMAWRVDGPFDVEAFGDALRLVAERNSALLTACRWDDEGAGRLVTEEIHRPSDVPVVHTRRDDEQQALDELYDDALRPFRPGEPLARAHVWSTGGGTYLLMVFSHLVFDGGSESSLFTEIEQAYRHVTTGQALTEAPAPFHRFAVRQRERFTQPDQLARVARIAAATPAPGTTRLPTSMTVTDQNPDEGVRHYARIEAPLLQDLQQLGRAHGASDVMVILAGLLATAGRLSGQTSSSVLLPYANRAAAWSRSIVGPCLNSLFVTADTDASQGFGAMLERTRDACLGAYEAHDVPAEALQAAWAGSGAEPRTNLMLNLFAEERPELRLPGCATSRLRWEQVPVRARVDLCVYGWPDDGGLRLELLYRTAAFTAADIASFATSMIELLAEAVRRPDAPLGALPIDGTRQVSAALAEPLEATAYPSAVEQVWTAADRWPDAVAVSSPDGDWTYRELVAVAGRGGARLRALGVRAGRVVAVEGRHDRDTVAASLAVLRAGGVLLLAGDGLPDARREVLYASAGPVVRVGSAAGADVSFAELCAEGPAWPDGTAVGAPPPDGPAYIFFTSGSTGAPKGVLGRHRGLGHFLDWERELLGAGPGDRVGWRTNLEFDVVLRDLLLPLVSGGTLVVPAADDLDNALTMLQWLDRTGVTLLHLTPSLAELLVAERRADPEQAPRLTALRAVLFAGEPLTDQTVRGWRRHVSAPARVVNLYGPTETTLAKCWFEVPEQPLPGVQPIGTPLPETQVLVLNDAGIPAGVGETGEIAIRTPHRSLGYLAAVAESEHSRFAPNPSRLDPDDLIYRTGDLGRLRSDGLLDIFGRADDEVKVHGVRVQPAEVAAALRSHPDVVQAYVLKRDDGHGLIGYVVCREGVACDAPDVLRHVSGLLPSAAVPSHVVEMPALPLLPNGKVDKRALTRPTSEPVDADIVAPRDATEAGVLEIFRDVLDIKWISVHDGFVALGGHSLLAMSVAARLQRRFGVRVPAATILDRATPATIAAWLGEQGAGTPVAEAAPDGVLQSDGDRAYRAGFAQERMFFLEELTADDAGVYHIPWSFRLHGDIDAVALRAAVRRLVDRHPPLRTAFDVQPDALTARPRPAEEVFDFDHRTLPGTAALADFIRAELHRPFDLRSGRCLRTTLVRLGPQDHALVMVVHHVAADGWSLNVLQAELSTLYDVARGRPGAVEPALPGSYADFAAWQRQRVSELTADGTLARVADHLRGAPERYGMPTDRPRGRRQSFRGDRLVRPLTDGLPERIRADARRRNVTPFALIAAAWTGALAARGRDTELVLGTAVANRPDVVHQQLVGCFINTVPMRIPMPRSGRLDDLITTVATEAARALHDADVPFERLLSELDVPRSSNHPPIFQAMLVMQQADPVNLRLDGVRVSMVPDVRRTAKVDLTLTAMLDGDRPGLTVEFNADLFDPPTVRRLVQHVVHLLNRVDAEDDVPRYDELPAVEAEAEIAAAAGPRRTAAADDPETLTALIRRRADANPSAPAVSYGDRTLTYRELVGLADAHAVVLRAAGVGVGDVVAVCLERSLELPVALLGVLAAGAAYLPLDSDLPADRVRVMLADAGARVLLTGPGDVPPGAGDRRVVRVDLGRAPAEPLDLAVPAGAPAYCIFTSGSTGTPKGVLVPHSAIVNRLRWMQDTYLLDATDVVLQKTPYTFDVSVWEFFWPLIAGARLAVARPGGHRDPEYLLAEIERRHVTVLHFVPPMLAALLDRPDAGRLGQSVRLVVCSGEALEASLRDRFFATVAGSAGGADPDTRRIRLENLYGPTEAAVDVSWYSCDPDDRATVVPIGRPIDGISLHFLDRDLRLVPRGGIGELHIGGAGLATAYVGRADLTADRFVPDPFAAAGSAGARLYRTGDLARRREDGEIEYLGRTDHQVKVRGIRIELGEIEERLIAQPEVSDAVVVVRDGPGGGRELVGYAVLRPDSDTPAETLVDRLRSFLPEFMCPSVLVLLPELPLGATGKVDRAALPDPDRWRVRATAYQAPASAAEQLLAEIWTDVLKLDAPPGAGDAFFGIGGDSLSAIRVVGAAAEKGWTLPLEAVFAARTLRDLAVELQPASPQPAAAAPVADFTMLSAADRALLGGADPRANLGGRTS